MALQTFATTEARLAVSVIIAVSGVVAASVLFPRLLEWTAETVRTQLERAAADSPLTAVEEAVTWPFPLGLVTRIVQSGILLAVGLALLVVWGYLGVAEGAVDLLVAAVPYVFRLLLTAGLLASAVVGTRVLETKIEEYTVNSDHINKHQQGIVFRVLQLTMLVAIGFAALSLWQVNLGGLLIGAGFLGIVFGMAARQTLGALIAGFVLMFSRPFEIGDWIEVNDREGIVTDITIINTRLRSFDGEEVVMPNDAVSKGTVVNRTRRGRLRIRTDVGIDYDADVDRAEELALEVMESIDNVAPGPKPQVIPKALDDSAVTLELRYWITDPSAHKKWQTKQAVVRNVKAAFDEAGVDIPFPQRTVDYRADADRPADD